MATHGMIDLETLGVEPDSVIITLGAVKFDPFSNRELINDYIRVVTLKNNQRSMDVHRRQYT